MTTYEQDMTECIQGQLAFAGVTTLTEVVEGEGSALRAGTVAIPSSSASLWQVREEKDCVTMQFYLQDGQGLH